MRRLDVELWTRDFLARLERGLPVEDTRVELKRDLTSKPERSARQVAGMANAARGEPVLWIIGADESSKSTYAQAGSIDSYWRSMAKCFVGAVPRPRDFVVAHNGTAVTAVLIEADEVPYIVRTSDSNKTEVPWREGTGTRSATRDDLLRLLVAEAGHPRLLVESAAVTPVTEKDAATKVERPQLRAQVRIYFELPLQTPGFALPFSRAHGEIVDDSTGERLLLKAVRPAPVFNPVTAYMEMRSTFGRESAEDSLLHTAVLGDDQLVVRGPGPIEITGTTVAMPLEWGATETPSMTIRFELGAVGLAQPIEVRCRIENEGSGAWWYHWTPPVPPPDD